MVVTIATVKLVSKVAMMVSHALISTNAPMKLITAISAQHVPIHQAVFIVNVLLDSRVMESLVTILMSVDHYFTTVTILVKFAQIQLDHIIVVVLLDSLVNHVLMSMSAIATLTIVTKKREFVTILSVRSHVNVIKDMSVMDMIVLTSMNVVIEISMIATTMQDASTLKVHMNVNVIVVFEPGRNQQSAAVYKVRQCNQ